MPAWPAPASPRMWSCYRGSGGITAGQRKISARIARQGVEMKLLRVGPPGAERPAVLGPDGIVRDASAVTGDYGSPFFAAGGLEELRQTLRGSPERLPAISTDGVRTGAPIARPPKLVGIGLNYADHAAESGNAVPAEPTVFMKATNTVIGPYDEVLIPRKSSKTDWEVELGVVIGRTARYLISPEEGLSCVAGYCVSNDVSEREFQLERGGQWVKGETMQDGSTANMVFGVGHLVWYLSQFMVLEPGDLLNTGTPAGVGMGHRPQRFLRSGDVMELEIEGLGRQRQACLDA